MLPTVLAGKVVVPATSSGVVDELHRVLRAISFGQMPNMRTYDIVPDALDEGNGDSNKTITSTASASGRNIRSAGAAAAPAVLRHSTPDLVTGAPFAAGGESLLPAPLQPTRPAGLRESSPRVLYCVVDHTVDESAPGNRLHSIISLSLGDQCWLVEGDLLAGLPGKYTDYCMVRRADGVVGRVSKWALSIDPPLFT